jgi:lipopolysaccharide exporter
MTPETDQVGRRMAKGAAWMVGVRLFDRSIGLLSTLVLARLLVPEDFGLVALAMTVIAVIEIWSEFSFDLALIRDQGADRRHYDTAWTLTLIRGLVVAAVLGLGAGDLAAFFGEPRLEEVLYVLMAVSAIEGLQSIRTVDFRKELNLHKEFVFLMTARVVQFFVTIALAYLWRDYWALVVGILANRAVRLVLSYWMAPYRPRLTLSAWGEIFSFSTWIVLNSVLNFLASRLDTLVVGRLANVSAVGIYSMAYEISNLATTELVWPISRAIFPGLAKMTGDRTELVRTYNRSLSLIVLLALPVTAGIAATAEYFVPLLLGEKWLPAVPIMQVLAVYGAMRVLVANTGSLYLAINRPYLIALMSAASLVVMIPLMIYLVAELGAVGAAWAVLGGSVPMVVLMFVFNWRFAGIRASTTLPFLARPVAGAVVMVALLAVLRDFLPPSANLGVLALQIALFVSAGAACYAAVVLTLWRLFPHDDAVETLVIRFLREKAGLRSAGARNP